MVELSGIELQELFREGAGDDSLEICASKSEKMQSDDKTAVSDAPTEANLTTTGLHRRPGGKSDGQNIITSTTTSSSTPPEAMANKASLISNHTLRPSAPAHKRSKESPLSSDAIFKQSHAGLFNLCIVVLVAVNGRLILENLLKYGLLMKTGFWFSASRSAKDWPLFVCAVSFSIFPLISYSTEKLRSKNLLSESTTILLHILNCAVAIVYPVCMIGMADSGIVSGILLMMMVITGWLKLVSYAHTNADVRSLASAGENPEPPADASPMRYPDNLTISNMIYFLAAPTLCYQLSYPRSATIRTGWVLRQFTKFLAFLGLMGFIIEQYINPTIKNSQHPLTGNYIHAIERVLKLSIPTLYVWLCLFYAFFHLWFNIVAELTRFGDREFYKDWWNARTVEEYWRMWNMPVHRWLVRHVYFPILRCGFHKNVALMAVFVISAAFHELCIGVPCHMIRCWGFLGMMFQVPLVILTNFLQRRFQSSMMGNMIFWFFFCIVGQPMCILLYYHDVMNQQPSLE